MRSSWTSGALLATACAHAATSVTLAPTSSSSGPPATVSVRATPVAEEVCPRVPLELVARSNDTNERVLFALDRAGDVRASLVGAPSILAHLDPRGCLSSRDGVEIDLADGHTLWTRNHRFTVAGDALKLMSVTMRIDPNGVVVRTTDGDVTTSSQLAFAHYTPRATCAARMLLVTLLLSAPSSDAKLPLLPPPTNSACPDLHGDIP